MKFISGAIYRHLTTKDLDILVIKVRYFDEKRTKLLVKFLTKVGGKICDFKGNGGRENITVECSQYKYWKRIPPSNLAN
jgi:hypothetical protein